MKLIRQTPNELTMRFRPWSKWMTASCLIGLGLSGLLTTDWATFDCSRNVSLPTQGNCTLTHQTLLTRSQRSWPLEQITEVHLETKRESPDKAHRTYYSSRIYLMTTAGLLELPFGSYEMDQPIYAKAVTEQIQQFLADPRQPRLIEQIDHRPINFFVFFIFLAIGGLFIIAGQVVTLNVNKRTKQLTVKRWRLLGWRTAYQLDQIADVTVQEKPTRLGYMGRIVLVLKGGEDVIVHSYDSSCSARVSRRCAAQIYCFFH